MDSNHFDIPRRNASLIAAISLLLMAILAPIANFSILNNLVVSTDAAKTFNNLMSSGTEFRIAITLFGAVAVLDIIVAWALFIFLKPINEQLSLLAAWFRIGYVILLVAALFNLLDILPLISNSGFLSSFGPAELHTHVMLSIKSFTSAWELSLIIFGFHLLLIGYLFLKAGYMKNVLGILLIVASFGYMFDGVAKIITPGYNKNVAAFTFIGEVVLIFWLFFAALRKR